MATRVNNKIVVIIVIIALIFGLAYLFIGYGTIMIDNSLNNETIFINSKPIAKTNIIKLRPGNYTIEISSPEYFSTHKANVSIFSSKHLNAVQAKRDFKQEIKDLAKFSFNLQDIKLEKPKVIDSEWFVCRVSVPTEDTLVVLKYKGGKWYLSYVGYGPENEYRYLVPQKVTDYLNSLGTVMLNGN